MGVLITRMISPRVSTTESNEGIAVLFRSRTILSPKNWKLWSYLVTILRAFSEKPPHSDSHVDPMSSS